MAIPVIPPDPVAVSLDGVPLFASPKCFSSGSVGWYLSTKADVNGERCQVSLSVVVIGSKPKPAQDAKPLLDANGMPIVTPEDAAKPLNGSSKVKRRPKGSDAV